MPDSGYAHFLETPERRAHRHVRLDRTARRTLQATATPLLFEEVADECPAGIVVIDAAGRIRYTNRRTREMIGLEAEEYHSRDYDSPQWNVTDFNDQPQREEDLIFARVMREGRAIDDVEHAVQRQDGTRIYLRISGQPVLDADGKMQQVIFTMMDVSPAVHAQRAREAAEHDLRRSERRFASALEHAPIGMAMVSPEGRFVLVNQALCNIVGYKKEELEQLTFQDITHKDDLEADLAYVNELLTSDRNSYQMQKRYIHRDRRTVWTRLSVSLVRDESGRPLHFIAQIEDITQSRRADLELREGKERLEYGLKQLQTQNREISALGELSGLLQACLRMEEIYTPVRRFCRNLFQGCAGALYLMQPSRNHMECMIHWDADTDPELLFAPQECWALRRGQLHAQCNEDDQRCAHIPASNPRDSLCIPMMAQSEILGMLNLQPRPALDAYLAEEQLERRQQLAIMVAERIGMAIANLRLRETLRAQSIRDPLTQLFNRRYLEESLPRELAQSQRSGQPLALLMIDVDHFKNFNDSHGHEAGDAALLAIATTLQSKCRGSDILCRYGGEELVMALSNTTETQALRRAEEARLAVAATPAHVRGRTLPPATISIGIALCPSHAVSESGLLHAADNALYQAKARGRNRVAVAAEPGSVNQPA